jgi:hypothetical protein
MADTVKRLNYYDHQFLRVPDFTDEQNYNLSMRRLHNSALHTWGIVQGLGVVAASGGTGTAVTVSAGFALDSAGREIVLAADTNLELGGVAAGTTLYITIAYDEQPSDPPTDGGSGSERTRITEAPKLSFSGTAPADASTTLILAKVPRVGTNGLGPVDASDRKQAGVVLGSDLTITTLTLKNGSVAQANWPVLSCSAANQASFANSGLLVNGNVGIGTASPTLGKLQTAGVVGGTAAVFASDGQGIALVASWPNIGFNSYFNGAWKAINTGYGGIIGVDEGAGGLHFKTADTVTGQGTPHVQQDRMRITNTGNVGIGTTDPVSLLQLRTDAAGKAGPTLTLMNGGGGAGSTAAIDFSGYDPKGEAAPLRIQAIDDGKFSADLAFYAKQPGAITNKLVETMRIASAGNVGIGIAGPGSTLDIVGGAARTGTQPTGLGLYVTADSKPDSLGIEFRHTNGSQGIGFGYNTIYATGSNVDQPLTIQSRGAGALTLTANAATMTVGGTKGNVGIGTATPAKPLDVAGSGGIRISQTASANATNEIYFQDNGQIRSNDDSHRIIFDRANNILELREFGDLVFSPGATSAARTDRLRITSTGKMVSPMWRVNHVMDQAQGSLPKSAGFVSGGGTLMIIFSGSGYGNGNIGMTLQLDGTSVSTTRCFTNETGSHKTFTANVFVTATAPAGNHTINLIALAGTSTDGNDWFNVTVLELPI